MFLGLDLGTTNVKVLVVDRRGRIAAEGSVPVERWATADNGVEQDIGQIWRATRDAIRRAMLQVNGAEIEAVGVSSQGGAMQLLDARGGPLGRVISWLDHRGKPFNQHIEDVWGEAYLIAHTGSNFSTTTLGQILRLKQYSPEILQAAQGIGFVGDMIVGRLCGRRGHDASSLSLAMLYNPRLRVADAELLARLEIEDKQLPDLLPACEPAGLLKESVARQTGLPAGIPVSAAIHDQYAAAIGAGAVEAGDVLVGTGTAWVLLAVTARLTPPVAPRTFVCSHPIDGLYGQLLSMGSVGAAVQWALELMGKSESGPESLDELMGSVAAGAQGLRFWPLATNGRPNGASLPSGGSLSGRTPSHSNEHVLRAVMEGLACELARHLSRFTEAGLPVKRLVVTGPAAEGRVMAQIIANVAKRPVVCHDQPAMSALGAATVARALVHPEGGLGRVAGSVVCDARTVSPDAEVQVYQQQLRDYVEVFTSHDAEE